MKAHTRETNSFDTTNHTEYPKEHVGKQNQKQADRTGSRMRSFGARHTKTKSLVIIGAASEEHFRGFVRNLAKIPPPAAIRWNCPKCRDSPP